MKAYLFIILSIFSLAQGQNLSPVDILKSKYDQAIKNATDPINKIYKTELSKILSELRNNPTETAKILEEFKRLGIEPSIGEVKQPLVELNNEKLFVGHVWKSSFGTEYHFQKNGEGYRINGKDKTTFIWEKEIDVIKIITKETQKGVMKNWYFRFINKNDARYGQGKEPDQSLIFLR